MFGWFKRRREEVLLRELLPALAQGQRYRAIREALKTIGIEDKEAEPDAFTAIAAASLARRLCSLTEADLSNDEDVFVGGCRSLEKIRKEVMTEESSSENTYVALARLSDLGRETTEPYKEG